MDAIIAELIEVITQDLPTDRDTTPIDETRDRALLHCAGFMDGGGNLVEGWSSLQGNDTVVQVFIVDHTTGARRALVAVTPPPTFKLDDFDLWPSGGALIVGMTAHEAISSPTRRNIYARAVVPNMLVPYPGGAEPRGAFIDPALIGGDGGPVPNPSPSPGLDPQAVAEAVLATLQSDVRFHETLQKYARNGARQALADEVQMENGVLQFANAALFLRTQDGFLTVLRDGLYQWMKERLWETLIQFLTPKASEK